MPFSRHSIAAWVGSAALIALACFASYRAGANRAVLREKVGQLDKDRKEQAATSAARAAKVDSVRSKADTSGRRAEAAIRVAKDFKVSPVPTRPIGLQVTPAKAGFDSVYVDSLKLAIATRDHKIALDSVAIASLQTQVSDLKLERPAHDDLVRSLNAQIALDVKEINLLKAAKLPRFGFKSGFVAGAATVATVAITVKKLTP